MIGHLRTNLGAIVAAILIFTVIPLAVEKWRMVRDERLTNATIHQLQYGDIRQFFRIEKGMTASDVKADDPDVIAQTTFERFAWRDISSFQTLQLSCVYNGGRMIEMKTRAPIRVQIEEGQKTITIAYSLHEFGISDFIAKGLDPKRCEFFWTKEWTLHLAGGIDRVYQLQSNRFRIVE